MSDAHHLNAEQEAALIAAGVAPPQFAALLRGVAIVYPLPTEGESGVAVQQLAVPRLRSGIIAVTDPGSGVKTLARFRGASWRIAIAFGLSELELFGAELINQKLAALLLRQGFQSMSAPCPDELGGGTMASWQKCSR